MPHITIVISSNSVPAGEHAAATEGVRGAEVTYVVPHGKTDAEIGRAVAKLIKGMRKLSAPAPAPDE